MQEKKLIITIFFCMLAANLQNCCPDKLWLICDVCYDLLLFMIMLNHVVVVIITYTGKMVVTNIVLVIMPSNSRDE